MVLLGDYGTGKTYHLRWIKGLLEARSDQVNIRVVSVETPGLEPYDLVRGILTKIGEQEIAKAIWGLLLPEIRAFIVLIPPPLRHTPRVLLTMCYDLVEEASEADLDKEEIPEAFVTKFLERYRLSFEEGSDSSDESH